MITNTTKIRKIKYTIQLMWKYVHSKLQADGFTLLEVLFAVLILTIGILGILAMQIYSQDGLKQNRELIEATFWAQDQTEKLLGKSYAAIINGNELKNNKYRVSWTVVTTGSPTMKEITMSVTNEVRNPNKHYPNLMRVIKRQ
ncbi:MAG: prepilin-type N-terminal cleavage/methylation domain-containing protein [Desulfobacterales bacterium]|nr:prepilin-type N-terminal cleavage/methylation domain-containing protein [Desulfobacterales bacterium]